MARYQLMTFIIMLSQSNLITQVPICMGGGGGTSSTKFALD